MVATSFPSFGTDFLNQTSGANTTPYWNPTNMESTWGIPNPAPTSTPTGGNMPFPWMAAATVAAPIIGGIFGNRSANSQREGAKEAVGLQSQMQADAMLAGFGAQELARDNEYGRQLRRGLDTINLMNSGPYIANATRNFGQQMTLAGQDPYRMSKAVSMFGGYG